MKNFKRGQKLLVVIFCSVALAGSGSACRTQQAAQGEFWGKTTPPATDTLNYVSGAEPETLDVQAISSQVDQRIVMALFDGLVEAHPKNLKPIPALAESWKSNRDFSEFVFYLRHDARWSNGDPITAQDFVYSLRRGMSPELASRSAFQGYYLKYAQDYNEGKAFARDPQTGAFVTIAELTAMSPPASLPPPVAPSETSATSVPSPAADDEQAAALAPVTDFYHTIHAPKRLTVPGDAAEREKFVGKNENLKKLLAGKEFVPIRGEDIGLEAVDDYTLRITLSQSAPFFVSTLINQFFRPVHRATVERYGNQWFKPEHIVTSGAFRLKEWRPYQYILVEKNPTYWDAGRVRLNEIRFYAVEELTTVINLYTTGEIDSFLNHSVPPSWIERIKPYKDYMIAPENAVNYYVFNTRKPPMDNPLVRRAFSMAIDRVGLAQLRSNITLPATTLVPQGVFPAYPQVKGEAFNVEEARKLLAQAGYKDAAGNYDPSKFPTQNVELTYNTNESNKLYAEYTQSQWQQNLGIAVTLKNMEFATFLPYRETLEYKGVARGSWIGDYMDPFTFLAIFSSNGDDNGTGWNNEKYQAALRAANNELNENTRFQKLAEAEKIFLSEMPIIPQDVPSTNFMKKPYVKGMYPNPLSVYPWKFVYIERDKAKWDYGVPDMSGEDF